ncbi:FadR/GntR family transcriptional regulator [Bacillus sp. REN16]|uniref:FadR/GntR family transcriptional regulator n=1 Tax=Bacillus sp. REN16 TaxID=2887296 RepID=UPI001E5BB647|nr:FCD domain-containing protein [Bacillus sp. REN16]
MSTETSSMFPKVVSWGMLLNTTEARQLIEARLYLETSLVELAAIRSTESERANLVELLKQMEKASDAQEFADFDSEFHLEIARSAKNLVLSSTLENTKSLLQAWVERVVENSTNRNWVNEQHTQILEAIENQDPVAAKEAMKAHLQEVTNRLLSSLHDAESGEK